ncbi:MAG: dihydropteroate synthase [Verrucomicrobiales bacterium]|nr:dihydropteroate synthase [Verrucomicrobiales bacterium]
MKWSCLDITFDLSRFGEIMGIVNVTPDSFSDGGRFNTVKSAVERADQLISEGAAIIDIGGESTRPGAADVSVDEERDRVIPVVREICKKHPSICVSVDTTKAEVALAAVEEGARIINDVSGFRDPSMIAAAASTNAGVVAMHMQGTPRTMQKNPAYSDVVAEVREFFENKFEELVSAGVSAEAIAFDPGIGFGKSQSHNLSLLRDIESLIVQDRPILLGVSRKSFLGRILESDSIEDRSWPTVAITSFAREKGVPLHRVHEVQKNLEALRMTEAILDAN